MFTSNPKAYAVVATRVEDGGRYLLGFYAKVEQARKFVRWARKNETERFSAVTLHNGASVEQMIKNGAVSWWGSV